MDIYRVDTNPIDLNEVVSAIRDVGCGGETVFLGTVRNEFEGRASQGLFYDAYRPLAEKEMARIGEELKKEFGVWHVVLIHRIGEMALSAVSVVVGISAPHREATFMAAHAGIDRIKTRVPIWKEERWADGGSAWHFDDADELDDR